MAIIKSNGPIKNSACHTMIGSRQAKANPSNDLVDPFDLFDPLDPFDPLVGLFAEVCTLELREVIHSLSDVELVIHS